jgi:cytochrome P450
MPAATRPLPDLSAAATFADGHPWEAYAWLRANDPVHWHEPAEGPPFWAVTRHADVRAVSRSPHRFSSAARGVMMEEADEASLAAGRLMMLAMDPPQHDRFKALVNRGFTPKGAQLLAGRIEQLAADVVDDVIETGRCDFVHDIAGRLVSGFISELMGMPRVDGERLYSLTETMHSDGPVEARVAAIGEMLAYAQTVAELKRTTPGADIASTLVRAEVDGDRLSDAEFQWFFLLLVNAGGDTTRNLLAAGLQLLFEHPDQRALLASRFDAVLPTAIEELLRYTTPVIYFRRTAMEDTEIGGRAVAAGDKVVMFYGAANRDEDVFADPDRLDLTRQPNPHVAFGGGGPHLCLGMHVARLEIAALLRQLVTRLPDLEPDGPMERMSSNFIAGVQSLPVRFSPGPVLGVDPTRRS